MDIPKKMRAAVLYGFNDVRIEERDVPSPGSDEVLLRVSACGICGTDVKVIGHGCQGDRPRVAEPTAVRGFHNRP
jgi:L-iditol 2-dehydrogenase